MNKLVNNAQKGHDSPYVSFEHQFEFLEGSHLLDESEFIIEANRKLQQANKNGLLSLSPELYGLLHCTNNIVHLLENTFSYEETFYSILARLRYFKHHLYKLRLITGNLTSGKEDVDILDNLITNTVLCFAKEAQRLNRLIRLSRQLEKLGSVNTYKKGLNKLKAHAKLIGLGEELENQKSQYESDMELPSLQEMIYGIHESKDVKLGYLSLDEFEKDWIIEEYPTISTINSSHSNGHVVFSNEKFKDDHRFIEFEKLFNSYFQALDNEVRFIYRAFNIWHYSQTGKTIIQA